MWNWAPAKVFKGDVGSTFLVLFRWDGVQASSWPQALAILLLAPLWLMRAFACFAGQPLVSESFRPTDCTCFSDCTEPDGATKTLLGCTQAPPPFWLSYS